MAVDQSVRTERATAGDPRVRLISGFVAAGLSLMFHIMLGVAVTRVQVAPARARRPMPERTRPELAMRLQTERELAAVERDVLNELRELSATAPEIPITETARTLTPDTDTARLAPADLPEPEHTAGVDSLEPPRAMPDRAEWQPRQEVLALESRLLESRPDDFDRLLVPAVERVAQAPDLILPLPPPAQLPTGDPGTAAAIRMAPPDPVEIVAVPDIAALPPPAVEVTREPDEPDDGRELFEDDPETVSVITPIEEMLTARLTTYRRLRDLRYGYFRMEIERVGPELVPRIPKDVVFVQDSSSSISELRLRFCRQALIQSLGRLHPDDRFNIIDFSDRTRFCFENWRAPDPDSIAQATAFINAMRADGSTDLFASMNALLELQTEPGRPVIAIVITDGIPTLGLTDSSDIIGRFSLLNQGRISLFTVGVLRLANSYLLDLLSYANRGDVVIAEGGRFDIESTMLSLLDSINRPAVDNLDFFFSRSAEVEVYPVQTSNLYLDRSLVLYGRYRRNVQRLVFQSVGKAGDRTVDMIFNLELNDEAVAEGESDIRDNWAKQKLYHLIADFTRTNDPALLEEIRSTARLYRQDIPHQRQLF